MYGMSRMNCDKGTSPTLISTMSTPNTTPWMKIESVSAIEYLLQAKRRLGAEIARIARSISGWSVIPNPSSTGQLLYCQNGLIVLSAT
jgi:hypothetical protein